MKKNQNINPLHFERAYFVHFPLDLNVVLQIWMHQAEDSKIVLSSKNNRPSTKKL